MTQEAEHPKHYYLDDSDIVALQQDDGTFVAAFSAGEPQKKDS